MNAKWRLVCALSAGLIRTRGPRDAVYLTFDDGPQPVHTVALLELLAQHDARATFFLVGDQAQAYPELVRRLRAAGHSIGNHSMNHPRMSQLDMRAQIAQIDTADAALSQLDPGRTHTFRPPNGRVTPGILLATLLRRRPLVLWSIDSLDYRLDAAAVVQHLRATPPRPGDILLFHDDGACAGDALAVLLPEWRRAGLRFEALPWRA